MDYHTTDGIQPYCCSDLPLGEYHIQEKNPPGYYGSTIPDDWHITLSGGDIITVEFGDQEGTSPKPEIDFRCILARQQEGCFTTYDIVGKLCNLWNRRITSISLSTIPKYKYPKFFVADITIKPMLIDSIASCSCETFIVTVTMTQDWDDQPYGKTVKIPIYAEKRMGGPWTTGELIITNRCHNPIANQITGLTTVTLFITLLSATGIGLLILLFVRRNNLVKS